jgi:transcriptional regulator with XRE-family HTH domain
MTDIRQVLAENMKKYRKIQGISQAKLAESINTATNYIAMIEIGKKFPSARMLEQIARALNVDTPELFTTQNVTFMPIVNVSLNRLFNDILGDIQQLEEKITGRMKEWQQV